MRGLLPALLAFGVLLLVVVIIALVGVIHAVRVEHRLANLTNTIRVTQTQAENGQLLAAIGTLANDETEVASVNSALYNSADFRLLDALPIARQNVEAARAATHMALNLLSDGRQILAASSLVESPSGHLEVSLKGGQAPTEAIQLLSETISSSITNLPTSPSPPHISFLLGSVRRGEQKVWTEAFKRRKELSSVNDGLGVLNALTGGSGKRRYLIAVANTAEMRGAGGMILSYGVLNADHGKVSLGNFGNIDQLALTHPAKAIFPADFLSLFGDLKPNLYWRNTTIMSDFTVDAPVLESMYTQATGLPVNGVIQIDPAGLGAILAGVGPITDPSLGTVTAANVVPLTLNAAYVDFPNRPVRQEYLAGVAREAFAALTSRTLPSLRPLGTALVAAAADRHILFYSSTPAVEADAKGLNVSGALPGPGVDFDQLTVQNFGGDKLDYYLHTSINITGSLPAGHLGRLTATISLRNAAPPKGKPRYIFGPYLASSKDPPGLYRGLVTLYLPAGATLTGQHLDALAVDPEAGTQNKLAAISYYVTIPAGDTSQVTLDVRMPPRPKGPEHFVVVPTPRIYPTETSINVSN